MPKVEETLGNIAKGAVDSKLDADSDFHNVPLSRESVKVTTFIMPFGRYMFIRFPYGISSALEYFQKQMIKNLPDEGASLPHGKNESEYYQRLASALDCIAKSGLILSPYINTN